MEREQMIGEDGLVEMDKEHLFSLL
jgi:hypothetical protein